MPDDQALLPDGTYCDWDERLRTVGALRVPTKAAANPISVVLLPLAEGLARARAQGFHIKYQSLIGMPYEDLRSLPVKARGIITEMDKAHGASYWRKLCRLDNRPCVYGEWEPYMNNAHGLLRIRIPINRNTQPIMAWVSMVASVGDYHTAYPKNSKPAYTRAVTYVSLRIPKEALGTLWSGPQGFVELARIEWKEILKPIGELV